MIQYVINKRDLHELLKMLHILQTDEEVLMVNNVELRDFAQPYVSILVDTIKNKSVFSAPPENLTAKELELLYANLSTLEQFLQTEYASLHRQLEHVRAEMLKRNNEPAVSTDGIPTDVDEQLSRKLKDLLSGDGEERKDET